MNWSDFSQLGFGFFSQVWRLFSVELPYLGLTAGQLLIGQIVVGMSIPLLKSLYATLTHGASSYRSSHRHYQRKGGSNDKKSSD